MSYVRLLWRSARRPAVARRCLVIALTVGTVLTLVNQWGALTGARSDNALWLRILANYLVPFVVSNLGAAASYANEQ